MVVGRKELYDNKTYVYPSLGVPELSIPTIIIWGVAVDSRKRYCGCWGTS